nr:UTP--glucose-1-phosphate uridylyltransferase [Bacillus methanolicus]
MTTKPRSQQYQGLALPNKAIMPASPCKVGLGQILCNILHFYFAKNIEDHFDNAFELEQNLIEKGKFDLLEKVKEPSKVDIHYIRQKEPKGLGHAVWCARNFIEDEPFAVLLGDDIVQAETPCLRQLIDQYEQTLSSVIGVQVVPNNLTHRYGIIDPIEQQGPRYQVRQFVEKPSPGTAPSNLAIMGRYIFTPEIFLFLEKQEIGAGGEIQLTDAIQKLNEIQRVFAYEFEGKRYDVGEKLGFIQTTIEFALQNEELKTDLIDFNGAIIGSSKNREVEEMEENGQIE